MTKEPDLFNKTIPATDYEVFHILRAAGLRDALNILDGMGKRFPAAPGLALAIAAIGREEADSRVNIAGYALQAVARAGLDIAAHPSVYTIINDAGRPEFVLKFDEPKEATGFEETGE